MDKIEARAPDRIKFSRYEKVVIGILGFLQFTVILDFMIISPLGAIVMPSLHISPQQFGLAVSSYAFSAGVSGFLAAGFADRSNRGSRSVYRKHRWIASKHRGFSDVYPKRTVIRTVVIT